MLEYDNFLGKIKNKFQEYKTYYEILGLKEDNITDEKVKEAYENKCKELVGMFGECKNDVYKELRIMIKTSLDDAYNALKTEHSRNNYKTLLNNIKGVDR